MFKTKKSLSAVSALFVAVELILGFLIHVTKKEIMKYLAFLTVTIACLFAFLFYCDSNAYRLTQLGLIFTVFADIFLVLLNSEKRLLAMSFFSVTQLCYFALLYIRDKRFKRMHIVIRVCTITTALLGTTLVLGDKTDPLSLVSIFYFANLLINVIWAFAEWDYSKILPFGLLMFAFCDVFIGFSSMSALYFPMPEGTFLHFLANPPFNIAWLFYVPAQTLIALSLCEQRLKEVPI